MTTAKEKDKIIIIIITTITMVITLILTGRLANKSFVNFNLTITR